MVTLLVVDTLRKESLDFGRREWTAYYVTGRTKDLEVESESG